MQEASRIFLILGEIQSDIKTMKHDLSETKAGVTDYRNTKNKLIGACIGVSAIVGGSLSAILKKMGF